MYPSTRLKFFDKLRMGPSSSPSAAGQSQRWLLWMFGLLLFLAPLLAPLTPFVRRSSNSQAAFSSEAGATQRWQLAGEQRLQPQIGAVQGITYTSEQGLTTLFTWSSQGLWRSADSGRTWTLVGAGLPTTRTGALALVDLQPGGVHTLYALAGPAGRRGLYRSTDRGARFDLLYQPLTFNPDLLAVQASDQGDSVVLAGDDTLVLSQDGGAAWRDYRTPGRIETLSMTSLGLWAAGSGGTNHEDASGWVAYTIWSGEAPASERRPGHADGSVWQLQVLPAGVLPRFLVGAGRGPVQWYLGHDTGLLRSSDSGRSWQPVNLPDKATPTALVIDPLIWQTLVFADASGGLWRSDDAGASWRRLAVPGSGAIRKLFLLPDDRDRLFAIAGFDLWWLPQASLQPTPTPTPTPTSSYPTPTASPTAGRTQARETPTAATATPLVPLSINPTAAAQGPSSPRPVPATAVRASSAVPTLLPVSQGTSGPPAAEATVAPVTPPPDTPSPPDADLPTATPQPPTVYPPSPTVYPPSPTPIPTATRYR